jgi:hypothetical protein
MKKITNKLALLFLTVMVSFTACDTVDFGDINTNPNSPSDGSPALILTGVQRGLSGILASTTTSLYVQYLSGGQYDTEGRYGTINFTPNYVRISNINKIIELNTGDSAADAAKGNASNANQIAVANLLKAYYFNHMTDRWGMLPFSEANKGLENAFPAYDTQAQIYTGIFAMIDSALSTMSTSGAGPNGDILFNGDMAQWAKFGNTMKMMIALKLAKADPTTGKAKFLESYNKGISSVAGNLQYTYLAADANDNPWQDRFETRKDYLLSEEFVGKLIGSGTDTAPQDPRLPMMAEVSFATKTYVGAPYGEVNSATDSYSFITDNIINKGDAPLYFYTYAEVAFARAEAAQLTWTSEDAATWYNTGIQASMDQWGVAGADATTYAASKPYADATDIAYERWVSQYLQGYNSWNDWRRAKAMGTDTKFVLTPAAAPINGTGIPQRHGYSASASALNEASYDAAIAAQGPDALETVLWVFK